MSKTSIDSYPFLGIKAVPFVSAFLLSMSGMLCLAPVPALADDEEDNPLLHTTQTLNDAISGIVGNYNPYFPGFNYSPQPSLIPSEAFQQDIQTLLGDDLNSSQQLFDTTGGGANYTGAEGTGRTGYLHFYWEKDTKGNYKLMQAWGNRFTNTISESADFAFSLAYQNYYRGTKAVADPYKYDWDAPANNRYLKDSIPGSNSIVRFLDGEKKGEASNDSHMDVIIEHGNNGQILKSDGGFTAQDDGDTWKTGIKRRVYADLKGNCRAIVSKGYEIPHIRNTAFIDNNYNGSPFIQVQAGGKIGELDNVTFINNFTTTDGTIRGGSIRNDGEIGSISGTFIGNYIRPQGDNAPWGGAIVNMDTGKIGDISGYFVGNHIQGEKSGGLGGVICSQGQIRSLTGVFIGNYTSTGKDAISTGSTNMRANSGVIRNYSSGGAKAILGRYDTVEIDGKQVSLETDYDFNTNYYKGKLRDDGTYEYDWRTGQLEYDTNNPYFHVALGGIFIGNWSSARGGVLFNNGEVHGMINGDFIGNYIYSQNGLAQGGAIANDSSYKLDTNDNPHLSTIAGAFIGNYVYNATEDAYKVHGQNADGGAIFNRNAEINNILADFVNNYAVSEEAAAHGGAIYNIQQKYRFAQDDVTNPSGRTIAPGDQLTPSNTKRATISNIGADKNHTSKFTGNYARGKTVAEGGAIYISTNFEKQDKDGNITNASNTFEEEMSAGVMHTEKDLRATMGNIYADFIDNYVESTGTDSKAEGGAIYISDYSAMGDLNGIFEKNYAKNTGSSTGSKAKGGALYIGEGAEVGIINAWFNSNSAQGNGEVRGGAMLVTKGATLGQISDLERDMSQYEFKATFQDNTAFGRLTKQDNGEYVFNADDLIDSIDEQDETYQKGLPQKSDGMTEEEYKKELLQYKKAYAQNAYLSTQVYGGAIRFDDSFISDLSASFDGNKTNGSGGALSVTDSGFIHKVSGNFTNNEAGINGGAVHNEGVIGYLGQVGVLNEKGEFDEKDDDCWLNTPPEDPMASGVTLAHYRDNKTLYDEDGKYTGVSPEGSVITRSDETVGTNQVGYAEYDGSIRGGFVNVSFIGNVVDGVKYNNNSRGLGGAIYTTDDLFIVAKDEDGKPGEVVFKDNGVIYKGGTDYVPADKETGVKYLNTAVYVDNGGVEGAMRTIYLVAEGENSKISVGGAIRGSEATDVGFVLRMRGNTDKDSWHPEKSGTIRLDGPVAQSYTIMDDVKLELGRCINYFSFGDKITLDPYICEETKEKAEKNGITYRRSDIFRKSHFSVRSGLVDLTNDSTQEDPSAITQFAFGTMTAYGFTYNYADYGAKDEDVKKAYKQGAEPDVQKDLYAKWRVDISLEQGAGDLITTFEVRDKDGKIKETTNSADGTKQYQMSKGRITLDSLTITDLQNEAYTYLDIEDEKNLHGAIVKDETSVKIQILNLVVLQDKETDGKLEQAIVSDYASVDNGDYLTSKAPIQLDNALKTVEWEDAIMSSDAILALEVRLATTKTYHDSVEVVGWRNSLAAWAEMTEDAADSRYDDVEWKPWQKEDQKIFTLKNNYYLTRDVEDLKYLKGKGNNEYDGAVYGDVWTIKSDSSGNWLDLKKKNFLTKVLSHQTARLENFQLRNVKDGQITNEGKLTLDTMTVEDSLKVQNNNTLTVTGKMTINNTITSDASQKGTMFIENSTNQGKQTIIDITGTVQNQNITHRVSGDDSISTLANEEVTVSDDDATITNLLTTQNGKVTQAFLNFTGNSLTMQGGTFNLGDMALNRLKLVNFNMNGGKVNVNSSTVDLANKVMGGIDASGTASGNSGVIWLDKINITSDGKQKVTHVKFVPEEVGDTVQDNNIRDNTATGPIWKYAVTYNDTPQGGANGYYTFTRTTQVNPAVQVGPVNDQTALATTLLIHDYAFEHANLYSDAIYQARREELYSRSYSAVTPMKGKDYAAGAASPTGACETTRAKGVTGSLRALWARPYAAFENVALSGGPKVSMNLYGALVGADSSVTEHRNGWLSVFTGYLGYVGSEQKWSGNRTRTNGGVIGATETLYKGDFYTAFTVSAGLNNGNANTMYGREDFHTFSAGAAARAGYNIALDDCAKYVLQPSLQVAYTYISTGDYTNGAGVHMKSDALQAIQVNPFVKFFIHAEQDWTPYVVAGYVWNLGGKSAYRANGDKLPELSIDPYAEYGLGFQKVWKDRYTFYGQALGRSGGRQGYEVSAGVRWNW